ncbi:DUF2922 domain-containing protein [Geomicrobium sp. JCM 19039]|uniref:DUF2922 domain-containing protein n=1 Tax=Geomicrobium sp. JCM 19039 TaxID=1460636 RepID=UPI00045F3C11|nr:DUF2922 domain-containing protein [Geomicrobium sp. JCM 19039]GAK13407.1 hypothetical protein JCM19039_3250 [Geomicrobium sp. JCM 19039]
MTENLELRFRNSENRMSTLSIPEPAHTLTAEQLEMTMNTIIEENVFTSSGGDLTTIVDARIVTRTVEPLFEANNEQ